MYQRAPWTMSRRSFFNYLFPEKQRPARSELILKKEIGVCHFERSEKSCRVTIKIPLTLRVFGMTEIKTG